MRKPTSLVTLAVLTLAFCSVVHADNVIVSVAPGVPGSPALIPTQYLAESWSMSDAYNNVTISADLVAFPGHETGATAYLSTSRGPATTSADILATASFIIDDSSYTELFSGLDLGPGTYYLVLATTDGSLDQGWENGGSVISASDASLASLGLFSVGPVDSSLPPGSNFVGYPAPYAFSVTAAEPGSLILLACGLTTLAGVVRRKL